MATKKQNDDQKRKADSESGSNPDETLSGSVVVLPAVRSIVKVLVSAHRLDSLTIDILIAPSLLLKLVTASLNNDVRLSRWSTEARQQIARDSSISRRIQHATFESDTDGIGDSVEEKPEDD
ncbi:hypothetical protein BD769DRAFT_1386483 [Suillus cothurnatus]|nr:hypothetical protein BD769DRAFT_1386483 [Suillus cothurnatus]